MLEELRAWRAAREGNAVEADSRSKPYGWRRTAGVPPASSTRLAVRLRASSRDGMHAALRALGVYEPALQLEMTVEVPMTDELRMRLLWHAKHVEAVAPAGLRSQLVARAEAAARTYRVQSWPPKPA